jgi:hypothetical protein
MTTSLYAESPANVVGTRQPYPFVEPAVFEIIQRRCVEWRPRIQQHRELVGDISQLEPKDLNNYFELNRKRQEADQILLEVIRDCNYRIYHLVGLLSPKCLNTASVRTEIELEQQLVEQCLHKMYNQGNAVNLRQRQSQYYRNLVANYRSTYTKAEK